MPDKRADRGRDAFRARLISLATGTTLRRCGVAAFLGALNVLALPPFHVAPLAVVAFGGLFLLLDVPLRWHEFLSFNYQRFRLSAALGWSFGFGFFVCGLYWIGNSFYVDEERFGVFAVPAIVGLAAFLAIFPAAGCALSVCLSSQARTLGFAAAWTVSEYARGTMFSGFPWNLSGYVWTVSSSSEQLAAVVGPYGLGFILVLGSTLVARAFAATAISKRRAYLLLGVVLLTAPFVFGAARLAASSGGVVEGVRLRLVQGNISQALKWRESEAEGILARYLDLSRTPSDNPPTHIVWPESAVPFLVVEDGRARERIAQIAPADGAVITGAVRRSPSDGEIIFNSAVAIGADGSVMATYDKVRLVPFGEFVPFRWLLPLRKMTEGDVDFTPGDARRILAVRGAPPFQPLICYEAIFPDDPPTEPESSASPNWLLNITNDAWFGRSIGPYQHFEMARMRAIERGVPLVRAANSGISAVTDAYGRIQSSLPLGVTGILDAPLPTAIVGGTLYSRTGDRPLLLILALLLLFAVIPPARGHGRTVD